MLFYKGNSSSENLSNLALKLRELQMYRNMILNLIYITGTRMIDCGINGLSRGITNEGVMAGNHRLDLFHKRKFVYTSPWIQPWWSENTCGQLKFCTSEDWYRGTNKEEFYLWTPPPGAADAAMDDMGRAIHKQSYNFCMMRVPRLLTSRWSK